MMVQKTIISGLLALSCVGATAKVDYLAYAQAVDLAQATRNKEFVHQYCYFVADVVKEAFKELADNQEELCVRLSPHIGSFERALKHFSIDAIQSASLEDAQRLTVRFNSIIHLLDESLEDLPQTHHLLRLLCFFIPQVGDSIKAAVLLATDIDQQSTLLAYERAKLLAMHGTLKIVRAFVLAAQERTVEDIEDEEDSAAYAQERWADFCSGFSDVVAAAYRELGDRMLQEGRGYEIKEVQDRVNAFIGCAVPFLGRIYSHIDKTSSDAIEAIILQVVERFK